MTNETFGNVCTGCNDDGHFKQHVTDTLSNVGVNFTSESSRDSNEDATSGWTLISALENSTTERDINFSRWSNDSVIDNETDVTWSSYEIIENITEYVHPELNFTNNELDYHSYDGSVLLNAISEVVTQLADNVTISPVNGSSTASQPVLQMRHPVVGALFAIVCIWTFTSNLVVIISVIKERYLHSVTNYFIASLALADCWIGAAVMPLGAVDEMLYKRWILGADWCDIWHSCDVLGSTASILHLCVISLDRYWAITDPITYPSKMTHRKAGVLIALVWFAALLISFPAIYWWRAVSHNVDIEQCIFTEDIGYLAFSSTISFYLPLIIMVFTYYRVYKAANEQTKSLRLGCKQVHAVNHSGVNVEFTLRIHRGGGVNKKFQNKDGGPESNSSCSNGTADIQFEEYSDSNSTVHQPLRNRRQIHQKNMSLSQKLARISKERMAAKTLGIVMGVFILCWLPFFSTNVIMGVCGYQCIYAEHIVLPLFTWLGWINSCMNPAIYAHRSREFRRAFIRVLCCSRSRRRRNYRNGMGTRIGDNNMMSRCSRFSNSNTISINCSKM